jgi:hypothetical protein
LRDRRDWWIVALVAARPRFIYGVASLWSLRDLASSTVWRRFGRCATSLRLRISNFLQKTLWSLRDLASSRVWRRFGRCATSLVACG